jgi:lysophospholipase L1-like esterase
MRKILPAIALWAACSAQATTITLIGDSTVASYSEDRAPLTGWGQVLDEYTPHTASNRAVSGTSSKTFQTLGFWDSVPASDYLLIQFGHNDDLSKPQDSATDPGPIPDPLPAEGFGSDPLDWYRHNLGVYVTASLSAGTTPILVAPPERALFNADGTVQRLNEPYADAARAVADAHGVALVDLNTWSAARYEELGQSGAMAFHKPGDPTHYNALGARSLAGEVARQLQDTGLFAVPGDVDADGLIDDSDLGNAFASYTGPAGAFGYKTLADGDVDGDGDVDDADLGAVFAGYSGSNSPGVPEPGTWAMILMGGAVAVKRRRKR